MPKLEDLFVPDLNLQEKVVMKSLASIGILSMLLIGCNGFNTSDLSVANSEGIETPARPTPPLKKDPKDNQSLGEEEETDLNGVSVPPASSDDNLPAEGPSATPTSTTTTTTTSTTTTTLPKPASGSTTTTTLPKPVPSTTTTTLPKPPSSTTTTTLPKTPAQDSEVSSDDYAKGGMISPTIYFFPRVYEYPACKDRSSSPENRTLIPLKDRSGRTLFDICKGGYESCLEQGSCEVEKNDGTYSIVNVINPNAKTPTFTALPEGHPCRHGLGVNSSCLDAFYTVAADLTVHKPGDVIFVPAVAKAQIQLGPNHKHNGYFIVRDRGGAIKGASRFDFFSGRVSWKNANNPFSKIKLGDKRTRYEFFKVTGETRKKVLRSRCWPKLPNPDRTCPQ